MKEPDLPWADTKSGGSRTLNGVINFRHFTIRVEPDRESQ